MEVKAVFFDIDGTLVNDRKSVLKSTKDAIKIVKDQGVLVGVATGRGPFFVKDLMEDLDLDFAVTYNGQYIFNKNRVLFTSPLSKSHLRQLITYAKKEGKEIALGTKDAMLGSKIMSFGLGSFSQRVSRFVPSMLTRTVSHSFNRMVSKVVPQKEEDLLYLMNQPIYQVLMLMTPEESEKAAADFQDLKLTRSNPFAADVIDSIWYIIDHFLKHVFELEDELEFRLLNNEGSITFRFSSQHLPTTIDFDFNHPFDPLYPPKVLVLDMDGKETILLPEENDLF